MRGQYTVWNKNEELGLFKTIAQAGRSNTESFLKAKLQLPHDFARLRDFCPLKLITGETNVYAILLEVVCIGALFTSGHTIT